MIGSHRRLYRTSKELKQIWCQRDTDSRLPLYRTLKELKRSALAEPFGFPCNLYRTLKESWPERQQPPANRRLPKRKAPVSRARNRAKGDRGCCRPAENAPYFVVGLDGLLPAAPEGRHKKSPPAPDGARTPSGAGGRIISGSPDHALFSIGKHISFPFPLFSG
jgi:hypothetical protein